MIVNEVKSLQANGSIKLSPPNADTELPMQGGIKWVISRAEALIKTGGPAKVAAGNKINEAIKNGKLTTVISGVNSNGMVIVKVKP